MMEVDIKGTVGEFNLDVAFSAASGVTAIFGRSGCGKTTLVNMIAGLENPRSGIIRTENRVLYDSNASVSLTPGERRVGVVFQEPRLFPHMSVKRNLNYATWAGKRQISPGTFDQVIAMLGVEPLLERYPASLSGGEKQRVAIGRALLSDPSVLLLDEPLSALDSTRKQEIFPWLERLRDEAGIPIIYVSHAMDEVVRLADTMVLMEDGKVAASGPVARVISRLDLGPMTGRHQASSLLTGTVTGYDTEYGLTEISIEGESLFIAGKRIADNTSVRLRIKARDIIIALTPPQATSARNILPCV
ncbi:MAG: molybdenum ABC transporter ATP-binding protein, partial [Rhodobacteraceae bacterium]|nr:molybdenum ABC transporter ATP-binding protein [Paracoccaceae bacterium]